jgi:hypothetical protein
MLGQDVVITPLPDGVRLLYTDFPLDEPQANVREFTADEVESMDLEALDYMYATEFCEDIWEDLPGESPENPSSASPNVPNDFGFMRFGGRNWQELNQVTGTITVSECRSLSTNCPYCQQDFTNGQLVAKHRCGHAVCTDCFDNTIHHGWNSCTLCRKGSTTRRARVNNGDGAELPPLESIPDEDLAVFIRPEQAAVPADPVASI